MVKLGPGAETACGTGTLHLLGKHKIFDAKGLNFLGEKYSEWVVGKNEPDADPVIQGSRVMYGRNGKHFTGTFQMVFHTRTGGPESSGTIGFAAKNPDGGCDLSFGIKKG